MSMGQRKNLSPWRGRTYDLPNTRQGLYSQCAKKIVSDNPPRLADFAIGLVNSVFNLPDGKVMLFEEFE